MPFSYFRVIRLTDTDAAGVIYFSNLLSICHEAYEDFLTSNPISFKNLVYHGSIALPIVHAEIDFFKPIYCGDRILIDIIATINTNNEFKIDYRIYPELYNDVTLAFAKTIHVCIDKKTRKRVNFPDLIKECLQNN